MHKITRTKTINLIIAYLFNIIDYIATAYWIHLYGIAVETNPFMRWMFAHNMAWIVKIIIVGGLFAVLGYLIYRYPRASKWAYVPLIVYGALTIYHFVLLLKVITM